jgi:hypothetical protein
MPKKPISVTLEVDNLAWLHGQARATKSRGVSETLDRIVSDVRLAGRVAAQGIRSVAGTIDLHGDDPDLSTADAYVQAMFDRSLQRPIFVRETAQESATPKRQTRATPRRSRRG